MDGESLSKAGRTKQFIIEKTAPVFNEKGFVGTSLADLTQATGLTKGSIYGNFANKDEVALAAFDYNFGRVNDYLKTKLNQRENALDRLMLYPEIYSNFLKIPLFKPGCPILNTSTEADDTHPALREKVSRALSYWKKSIENQVKRGIERKELKADTDPTQVAVIIMTMIEGSIMQAKVTGRSTELKIAMEFLKGIISGLKA